MNYSKVARELFSSGRIRMKEFCGSTSEKNLCGESECAMKYCERPCGERASAFVLLPRIMLGEFLSLFLCLHKSARLEKRRFTPATAARFQVEVKLLMHAKSNYAFKQRAKLGLLF
jgi:hypothetical protein